MTIATGNPSTPRPLATPLRELPSGTTRVELEYLEGQTHHRLLFGHPVGVYYHEHHFGITRQTAVFEPGARFGLELWEGTTVLNRSREPVVRTWRWRILILEAVPLGQAVPRIPNVMPGAAVLLDVTRAPVCRLVKSWLAELERQQDLALLPRAYFLARDLRLQSCPGRDGRWLRARSDDHALR